MTTVLVYSEDPVVRDQVRLAVGTNPAAEVGRVDYLMTTTGDEVVRAVEERLADLLVLDGEAWPTGGMAISRELKNADVDCPPVIVLIARRDDRWLAAWSQADAVVMHPIDAYELSRTAVRLLTGTTVPGADRAVTTEEHP